MAGTRDKKDLTFAELHEIADTLGHFRKRYVDLADLMKEKSVATIYAGNIKLLKRGLTHILKAVNAAYLAYDNALANSGPMKDNPIKKTAAKAAKDARAANH
jgi:hypothetical protein